MGEDEVATLQALKAHRIEVVDPAIAVNPAETPQSSPEQQRA